MYDIKKENAKRNKYSKKNFIHSCLVSGLYQILKLLSIFNLKDHYNIKQQMRYRIKQKPPQKLEQLCYLKIKFKFILNELSCHKLLPIVLAISPIFLSFTKFKEASRPLFDISLIVSVSSLCFLTVKTLFSFSGTILLNPW